MEGLVPVALLPTQDAQVVVGIGHTVGVVQLFMKLQTLPDVAAGRLEITLLPGNAAQQIVEIGQNSRIGRFVGDGGGDGQLGQCQGVSELALAEVGMPNSF